MVLFFTSVFVFHLFTTQVFYGWLQILHTLLFLLFFCNFYRKNMIFFSFHLACTVHNESSYFKIDLTLQIFHNFFLFYHDTRYTFNHKHINYRQQFFLYPSCMLYFPLFSKLWFFSLLSARLSCWENSLWKFAQTCFRKIFEFLYNALLKPLFQSTFSEGNSDFSRNRISRLL